MVWEAKKGRIVDPAFLFSSDIITVTSD